MRLTLVEWHFSLKQHRQLHDKPGSATTLRQLNRNFPVTWGQRRRQLSSRCAKFVVTPRETQETQYLGAVWPWCINMHERMSGQRCLDWKGLCGQTHKRKSNITTVSRTKSTKYLCHQAAVVFTASSVWQQPLSCQDYPHVANTRFRLKCLFKVC